MTKRVLIAAGLAAALISGGALALAQPPQGPGPGPRMHGGPGGPGVGGPRDFGLRGIELTDAQKEQVKSIRESHKAEFQAIGEKMRAAHDAFAQATQAETVDEASVRAKSTAVASAMADEAILRAKVRTEINAILTPEQLEQLKTRQEQMNNRRPPRG
jgi:periplasmic protein CpxP/Spy